METNKNLPPEARKELIKTLNVRFNKNLHRHQGLEWMEIQDKIESNHEVLWSLNEMEKTGGEPDLVIFDTNTKDYIYCDFSMESPQGRRSLCYDQEALGSRKTNKPRDSALNMAESMGIELLTEDQYRKLQNIESLDTKTSSWIKTPDKVRKLGGALYCDRRYNQVFLYHNGADSYYATRGFRGSLKIKA